MSILNNIFAVLFLIATFIMVITIINPKILERSDKPTKQITKYPRLDNLLIWGFIAIVMGFLTGATDPANTITTQQVATKQTKSVSTPAPKPKAAPKPTPKPTPAPAPAKTTTTPAKVATPAPKPAPAPAPSGPKVLLDQSGNGIASTAPFTTGSNWSITYTFDCTSFGSQGNFQIYINNTDGSPNDDAGANQLATSGGSTDYYYDAGSHSLEINSECDWHVTVKG